MTKNQRNLTLLIKPLKKGQNEGVFLVNIKDYLSVYLLSKDRVFKSLSCSKVYRLYRWVTSCDPALQMIEVEYPFFS